MPKRRRVAGGVRVPVAPGREYDRRVRREILAPLARSFDARIAAAGDNYVAIRMAIHAMPFDPHLAGLSTAAAKQFIGRLFAYHKRRFQRAMARAFGVKFFPIGGDHAYELFLREGINNNVALIKTIPKRYHEKLVADINAIQSHEPFDRQAVARASRGAYQQSGRNITRIARDQTSKMIGQLTEARQREAGVERYIWSSSEDERVRPSHSENNGVEFTWDMPPVTGPPGAEILCRCVALAIIEPSNTIK